MKFWTSKREKCPRHDWALQGLFWALWGLFFTQASMDQSFAHCVPSAIGLVLGAVRLALDTSKHGTEFCILLWAHPAGPYPSLQGFHTLSSTIIINNNQHSSALSELYSHRNKLKWPFMNLKLVFYEVVITNNGALQQWKLCSMLEPDHPRICITLHLHTFSAHRINRKNISFSSSSPSRLLLFRN